VFINYASFRSAFESSMEALQQATVKVVAVIAEGVPEKDTKQMIAYARANNKVLIGPATVGGVQAGAFKIGDTAGTLDNITACKLYRPGSVGFVSKSGGMSNELYNVLSRATDGLYEGEDRSFKGGRGWGWKRALQAEWGRALFALVELSLCLRGPLNIHHHIQNPSPLKTPQTKASRSAATRSRARRCPTTACGTKTSRRSR
jgi:hypothetical protein